MEVSGGDYLASLLIAIFAVLVAPYYLSKLIVAGKNFLTRQSGQNTPLSTLIQRKIRELDISSHYRRRPSPHPAHAQASRDHPSQAVIKIYQVKIRALEQSAETPGSQSELTDLQQSLQLLQAALAHNSRPFKVIAKTLDQLTKSRIPLRNIINAAQACLSEKLYILSAEHRRVMSYPDIAQMITSRTLLHGLAQDALFESSTVCRMLERAKRRSPEQVYQAIRLMVLLKSGASQKALYEMALRQPVKLRSKFRALQPHQIGSALRTLLKTEGRGQYLLPEEVLGLVYRQLTAFEQFKKEFIQRQAQEQERKNRRTQRDKAKNSQQPPPRSPLEPMGEYYQILGCQRGDSTTSIKKRYRKLVLKTHPDRLPKTAEPQAKEEAHQRFLQVQEAYHQVLKTKQTTKKAA